MPMLTVSVLPSRSPGMAQAAIVSRSPSAIVRAPGPSSK